MKKSRERRSARGFGRAALVLLLGAAACGTDQRVEPGAVLQRDSAGIIIVETPGVAARAPIGWSVGDAPDLQIGQVSGDGPEVFHMIGGIAGGIAGLPNDQIVVVDGGSAELRFFDADGSFLHRVGGPGDGPGEFRMPQLVPYVSNDSLLIFDTRLRRFTLLSSAGNGQRAFPPDPLPRDRVIGAARGAAREGILMTRVLGTIIFGQVGQQSDSIGVHWINVEAGQAEVVAQYRTFSYGSNDLGEMHYMVNVPFSSRPSAAMAPNGFFVAGGDVPEVREFDITGQLTRILRLGEVPRPVTSEDIEMVVDAMARRFSVPASQARRVYEQMEFPDQWPTFQSLRVDELGWLWAELYQPLRGEASRWMIFDPSGVARGNLEIASDFELHDIGSDYVLGRWRDDLGVEYVRRYRLNRGN